MIVCHEHRFIFLKTKQTAGTSLEIALAVICTPAIEIRRLVPAEVWDSYHKFCFDRNPWDKTVSHYHWQGGDRRLGSVKRFLRSGRGQPNSNYKLYSFRGFVAVDHVYRYEDLEGALSDLTRHLRLEVPLRMPAFRAPGVSRPDQRHYRDVLTDEEAEMIAIACAREIRLLGCAF